MTVKAPSGETEYGTHAAAPHPATPATGWCPQRKRLLTFHPDVRWQVLGEDSRCQDWGWKWTASYLHGSRRSAHPPAARGWVSCAQHASSDSPLRARGLPAPSVPLRPSQWSCPQRVCDLTS